MISSPCYTCFTVLTLWASSFSSWSMGSSSGETEQPGKVTSGCADVLLRVNMSNEGNFFTHSECCRESRSRRACSKSQNPTWAFAHLLKRHTTTFCSPIFCENFHLRGGFDPSPADLQTGENGIDITSGFRATGKGGKTSPPQPPLRPSRPEATPARAGIVSPWQPADEWWPGGLCCGWLTGEQQTIK